MPPVPSLRFQVLQLLQGTGANFTAMGLDHIVRDHMLPQLEPWELRQLANSAHFEIGPWALTCLTQRQAQAARTINRAVRRAYLRRSLTTPLARTRHVWNANPGIQAHFGGDFTRFARAILED